MSYNDENDSSSEITLDLELKIDQICDAFELNCQRAEKPPRIEDYIDAKLGGVETQIVELVRVEIEYRRKAGDTPLLEEYTTRFPNYAHALRGLQKHFRNDQGEYYRSPPGIENLESFEFLGAGSFGAVWKAWDTSLLRFVAVKTPVRPVPTTSDRELIQREAQVVARVKHPHIVPVHYTGEKDGRIYVVYEFVAGETLQNRLRTGTYTQLEAAKLCLMIANAIHHVHALGIVHRDLKPANIMIDQAGHPHVMDFGLAKLVDATTSIGVPGSPLGTFAYMSPEQAQGNSKETDARSDIFSVGAILYEVATGQRLYYVNRQQPLLRSLRSTTSTWIGSKEQEGGLNRICEKCLQQNKLDRYRSAEELAADLKRFIQGEPVTAQPVTLAVRGGRWLLRHALLLVLAFLAIIPIITLLLQSPKLDVKMSPLSSIPRRVFAITEPAGARISVMPCDPLTGEVDRFKQILIPQTPASTELLPGLYLLNLKHSNADRFSSFEVYRTVSDFRGAFPSMGAKWEQSEPYESGIRWPVITIPPEKIDFEMAYIAGTDKFTFQGQQGTQTVSISPFYVATREFTFGDFLKIRPGRAGNTYKRPAPLQPPQDTMPTRYDWAQQWAEEAGCRLLTDLEFSYLAHLSQTARLAQNRKPDPSKSFDEAGAETFDEIATDPPVRGILSGYAEWTSTWPGSPLATVKLRDSLQYSGHPELQRIIRGGTTLNSRQDYPRNPDSAAASSIYKEHPTVGFRLARTPPLKLPRNRTQDSK